MDSSVKKSISVNLGDGKVLKFLECDSGLYFYDTRIDNNNKSVVSYSAVQTVTENELFYTKSEMSKAKKAIRYQEFIGCTSTLGIYEIINEGQVSNCDITGIDAKRAVDIYGKEEWVLKSWMKRVKPNRHSKEHKVLLPMKVI